MSAAYADGEDVWVASDGSTLTNEEMRRLQYALRVEKRRAQIAAGIYPDEPIGEAIAVGFMLMLPLLAWLALIIFLAVKYGS